VFERTVENSVNEFLTGFEVGHLVDLAQLGNGHLDGAVGLAKFLFGDTDSTHGFAETKFRDTKSANVGLQIKVFDCLTIANRHYDNGEESEDESERFHCSRLFVVCDSAYVFLRLKHAFIPVRMVQSYGMAQERILEIVVNFVLGNRWPI